MEQKPLRLNEEQWIALIGKRQRCSREEAEDLFEMFVEKGFILMPDGSRMRRTSDA